MKRWGWLAAGLLLAATGSAGASPEAYPVVDAADLTMGSTRYLDQDIEVRGLQCYAADRFDYRCTSRDGVAIFLTALGPQKARETLDRECRHVKIALTSPKCRVALRFTHSADRINTDRVDGERRVILRPLSAVVVTGPKR